MMRLAIYESTGQETSQIIKPKSRCLYRYMNIYVFKTHSTDKNGIE